MTNIEYIRSLNEKELFDFLYEINLDRCFCPARRDCGKYRSCEEAFIAWLNEEHKE